MSQRTRPSFTCGAVHTGADVTAEAAEFGAAMQGRQQELGRLIPAHDAREILRVAGRLGYRKAKQRRRGK